MIDKFVIFLQLKILNTKRLRYVLTETQESRLNKDAWSFRNNW